MPIYDRTPSPVADLLKAQGTMRQVDLKAHGLGYMTTGRSPSTRAALRRSGTIMRDLRSDAAASCDRLTTLLGAIDDALDLRHELKAGRLAVDAIPVARQVLKLVTKIAGTYRRIEKARTEWTEQTKETEKQTDEDHDRG